MDYSMAKQALQDRFDDQSVILYLMKEMNAELQVRWPAQFFFLRRS